MRSEKSIPRPFVENERESVSIKQLQIAIYLHAGLGNNRPGHRIFLKIYHTLVMVFFRSYESTEDPASFSPRSSLLYSWADRHQLWEVYLGVSQE